jgi:phage replication-related protein YjqB (UPF0714/DUF867 family)
VTEGTDYARRYKRHEMYDNSQVQKSGYGRTAVMAMRGGSIESGTSEICLGIAGYHPATFEASRPAIARLEARPEQVIH